MCEALPIRHGNCRDTFPAGEGCLVGRARAWLPCGRPASPRLVRSAIGARGGVLLRRPTEVTQAPPAMERVGQGAAHLFRIYRIRTGCSQRHRPTITAKGVQGGNGPLAPHDRVAAHPLCAVTPASAARPPRAVPSHNPHDTSTRAQHDRRRTTQSREKG